MDAIDQRHGQPRHVHEGHAPGRWSLPLVVPCGKPLEHGRGRPRVASRLWCGKPVGHEGGHHYYLVEEHGALVNYERWRGSHVDLNVKYADDALPPIEPGVKSVVISFPSVLDTSDE